MTRWLVLRLEAPMMSFGGVAVDHVGPTMRFPGASMLTGLLANALGWHWSDRDRLQDLQDRLVHAARLDRMGTVAQDLQNAQLAKNDRGWTTRGRPEGRGGLTYATPHRRFREYLADASLRVVLRLLDEDREPTLGDLEAALDLPARPLFLGRKPFVPSAPLLEPESDRWIEADTAWAALCAIPGTPGPIRAQWPAGEGPRDGKCVERVVAVRDRRSWHAGVHAGTRSVIDGWVQPDEAA